MLSEIKSSNIEIVEGILGFLLGSLDIAVVADGIIELLGSLLLNALDEFLLVVAFSQLPREDPLEL